MEFLTNQCMYSLIFLSILTYYLNYLLAKPTSKLPGPWYSKLTGAVLDFKWIYGNRAPYVHELHQKYGPVVRITPDEVSIADLDTFHEIYAAKETYRKSQFYTRFVPTPIADVFSTTDAEYHLRHRRLLAHPMSESSLKTWAPRIQDRISFAIERMKEEMDISGAADVLKWWLFMATDVIGELTFGDSFHMLEEGQYNKYAKDLSVVAGIGPVRSTFPTLVHLAKYLPIPALKKVRESAIQLKHYAETSLSRYQRLLNADPTQVQKSLFTKLFEAQANGALSMPELIADAQAYIVAGSDTTASTLTYLIWSICSHSEVKAKLVQELETLPKDFVESDLRRLKYLNQAVHESLRLYGAAQSGLPRIVPLGGATLAGHMIPAATTVSMQAHSIHRDPSIFPRPTQFDPSRWENPTKERVDALVPFSRGARSCIGKYLAQIELRLGAAMFFRRFPEAVVSTIHGMSDKDMEPAIYFVLSPRGRRCLIQEKAKD